MLDPDATLAALKPVFEDPAVEKVNQNIKFDQLVLRRHGRDAGGRRRRPDGRPLPAARRRAAHGLDDLTRDYLGHENIPITDLIGKGKKQITMDQVPTAKVAEYAGEDADAALQLAAMLEPQLDSAGPAQALRRARIPLIDVLAEMEFTGIRLDVPFLKKLGERDGDAARRRSRRRSTPSPAASSTSAR